MTGDFSSLLNTVLEEGQRQTGPTLALIGWKAGHSHWLVASMGFWERTFKQSAPGRKSQLVLSPLPAGVGGGVSCR